MNKVKKVFDYLSARLLEQSSFTAYITAIIAANSGDLPTWAKAVLYAAATYKWLVPEGETLCNVGKSTLRNE